MEELEKILKRSEYERDLLKHPYVGTEHLMLSILSQDNDLTNRLKNNKLTYNKFRKKLKEIIGMGSNKSPYILYTPMLRKVLNNAEIKSNNKIDSNCLFSSLLEAKEGIAYRILEEMNIDIDKLKVNTSLFMEVDEDNIISNREKEIQQIFQILMRKNKCNPLLIGEAGVGKTAIVEEIQKRLNKNDVPKELLNYNILNIDLSSIVAGTKYRGDFEEKINNLLKSVESEKIILFIDEIHTLVHAGGAEGAISAGDIIKPYLSRGNIKCIGATTLYEYHKYFEIDSALNRRFQKVIISEPDYYKTVDILNKLKKSYEKYHNVSINDNLINEIVSIANKYITNKNNPDKSIELLDSCCTNARYNECNIVDINNLYNVFEYKFNINIKNKKIKDILDNKLVILSSYDNILRINNINNNIISINGENYNNSDDLNELLGNPLFINSDYILKNVFDNPVGILTIINYENNSYIKDIINNIISKRKIINNYGQIIDLSNYIIIMEESNDNCLGFISSSKYDILNKQFIKLDETKLLQCI